MPLNKDSLSNTLIVATVLCLVCSLIVSVAAVGLKPLKDANVDLDRKKNILKVAGFTQEEIDESGGIIELFDKRFEAVIIDLSTGEEAAEDCETALEEAKGANVENILVAYDQFWCSKSKKPSVSDKLGKKEDAAGIKYREKYSHVFMLKSDDGSKTEKYVFPIRGYGLWSMLKGFISVEPDFQTVAGLTFYEHGETPGLGGEVENAQWKAKWPGKKIYQSGNVALKVSKGDQSANEFGVDALSGATITSNGVSNMMEYWLGPSGFGPYIERQKNSASPAVSKKTASNSGGTNG